MVKSSGNLIGCCVANIGSSSKFRCNECHQKCHQSCVTNLCHKMFQNEFSSPILSHAHILIPKSVFSNFSFYPEFSVYVLQSEKKIFVNFLSRSRSNEVIGIKSLFYLFDLVVSLFVTKTIKAVINLFRHQNSSPTSMCPTIANDAFHI